MVSPFNKVCSVRLFSLTVQPIAPSTLEKMDTFYHNHIYDSLYEAIVVQVKTSKQDIKTRLEIILSAMTRLNPIWVKNSNINFPVT